MAFVFQHTRLGFCWLDLIALAILVFVVALFVIKRRKMQQQVKELQDQLSTLYSVETMEAAKKD